MLSMKVITGWVIWLFVWGRVNFFFFLEEDFLEGSGALKLTPFSAFSWAISRWRAASGESDCVDGVEVLKRPVGCKTGASFDPYVTLWSGEGLKSNSFY